ncbi:MAG: hypothetical protein KC776_08480 [Myxococcales bacterium]|nr:hypothetical protein [Myxococcales bacterium]MCB9581958.1 hypothetical protein [Polyangiaceae bacterium]
MKRRTSIVARAAATTLTLSMLATSCADNATTAKGGSSKTTQEGDPKSWTPSGTTGECNLDALLQPYSYVSKVKTLLTGEAVEESELAAVEKDPNALEGLIDVWVQSDAARDMLVRFFMTAFQQTGLDNETFFYPLGFSNTSLGRFSNPTSPTTDEMLNANFSESFARTAYEIVKSGQPWTDVLSTNTIMMTTAQMAYMAYQDDVVVDDDEKKTVRTTGDDFPTLRFVANQADAPPASESLDPSSSNFGKFWHGKLADLDASCNVASVNVVDTTKKVDGEWRIASGGIPPSFYVFSAMLGRHQSLSRHNAGCNTQATNKTPLMEREDFSDWHMVQIRKPKAGETATKFYDLKKLRGSNELVIHSDRPGFLGSPGFLGTWPTNEDNSARVVMNQILIVALGASFDGKAVSNFKPTDLDEEHAAPGTECYGCHQTLDPMRDYVRASYTNFAGQQLDTNQEALSGHFVFGGVQAQGSGILDLVDVLAKHPFFSHAWAQKLCFYANSEACPEGEELDAVVKAFEDSGLDFRVLVRKLFSSPLVTGSACAAGVNTGTTATIARRSQFCLQLSHRLGIDDICNLQMHTEGGTTLQNQMRDATSSIPDDGFSRAVVDPVTIGETGMFTRANREAACTIAALNAKELFDGKSEAEVMPVLVEKVMALPASDPRHDQAQLILENHVSDAMDSGKTEKEALQSAFVVACMSPGSAGVGF